MKKLWCVLIFVVATGLTHPVANAQSSGEDQQGCSDHPLFSRMPNFHISECATVGFDSRKFPVGPPLEENKPKQVQVEGALVYLRYDLNEGAQPPSGLQIMRNFENATRTGGGTVQGTYPEWCQANVDYDSRLGNTCSNWGVSMKFVTGSKEVWAYMQMTDDTAYGIQIIERETMKQQIVVNVEALQQGLNDSGHIAVYDILFDTGKADVKSESDGVLRNIAQLLSSNQSLRLHVVGHTDNVGDPALNMKLSQARAAAVVAVLRNRHGVAAGRLNAVGAGPYAPVASNRTDDGKARNRRVELVEQ